MQAKEDESLGRLVNDDHRNPTAKMRQLSVQGKPHLCLFADRDISPGEEITYNYGDSDWPWRCKGLDEVMPLETCGATQATSPNENIEEMVKNSDCTESYTKTTGPVLSPLSRAEKWSEYHTVYRDNGNARRTIKKWWAKDEVAAVMRHFKCHIAKGNLATKSECQHCKLVEGKVLDERTVQNVRDFVRNRGIARKRQSQSQ
ncbi:hypothetical protein KUCAC02_008155 [Chaenocephalus aceratus]|uniref:Uncharacterized protein n=1 Tax=Chaenocephalus aceratus TaxID=36190 RepID=A0ACB9X7L5_CHAAC|nr:hypothetical protein KUCAC02_008155 [Chaenocephalus aceratus]